MHYMFLDAHKESTELELWTTAIKKIRRECTKKIWNKWSNERHWGPRVGVIAISTMEESAEKVCFFLSNF